MSLFTDIDLKVVGRQTSALDLATVSANHVLSYLVSMPSGTADGSADLVWSDTRSLATTTEDLDIRGGLTDAFGATLSIVELNGIMIAHRSSSGTLTVGGDAGAPVGIFADTTDKIVIQPGGVFVWIAPNAGVAVGAASTDVLQIQSSATVVFDILIWGRSA